MGMFYNYENINEMDIINLDMPNLKYADYNCDLLFVYWMLY